MPNYITPVITEAGFAAAMAANSQGLELQLTHVAFGSGSFVPDGSETALVNELRRVPIAGGARVSPKQIRLSTIWSEAEGVFTINEFGFYAGPTLFAVYSHVSGTPIGVKTPGVDFVFSYDFIIDALPANSVTIQADAGQSAFLAMLTEHETNPDAHPQYATKSQAAVIAAAMSIALGS